MDATALYRVEQIRHLESEAARPLLPRSLMLRAAQQAFNWIQTHCPLGKIAVLCGPGNNGGDGWALATLLHQAGRAVHVFSITPAAQLPDDARHYRHQAPAHLFVHTDCPPPASFECSVIVDALFGLGLARSLKAPYPAWIVWANNAQALRLALDVPSGLNANTGAAQHPCFRAHTTLTFLANKPGLHTADGVDCAGQVELHDLGVDLPLPPAGYLLHAARIDPLLPARQRSAHKGSHGTLAVVGGQSGMEGAALLAARTALLSGSGKVFIGWAQEAAQALRVDTHYPELMLRPLDSLLSDSARLGIHNWAVGCGLGTSEAAQNWLHALLTISRQDDLVLDADALNLLAESAPLSSLLLQRERVAVLTPHPLEAARLLDCSTQDVQADRVLAATTLARRFQAVVVLKGAGSVVANPQGDWLINTSGNPGLATAGTGDVLAGLIGSLSAQGLSPWEAAQASVYLHGAAADRCVAEGLGPIGLRASDLPPVLRQLINQAVCH